MSAQRAFMATPRTLSEARQLARLRRLREDAAFTAVERCRDALAERQRVVQAREQQIKAVRDERMTLFTWQVGPGAPALPRLALIASARQAGLDDELERAEFGLIDERHQLTKAEQALAAARAEWARAQARSEAAQTLADAARRALGRNREQRAERELDAPALLENM